MSNPPGAAERTGSAPGPRLLPAIRSIVVPLDGSELSERALPLALALADAAGATVHVVHVFVPFPAVTDVPGWFDDLERVAQALERGARDYLRDVQRRFAGAAGERVTFELVKASSVIGLLGDTRAVVTAIGELVLERRPPPDLIVMTSHGRGGASRAWLGSVADAVIRRSGVPVLLVRSASPTKATASPLFNHVLVPLDGSSLAEQMLPVARVLVAHSKARLTLLRVVIPLQAVARPAPVARIDKEDLARQRADAEEYFRRIRPVLDLDPKSLDTVIVVDKSPARAIIEYAETHDVDLIAMTTHGFGGVKRLVIGSVADKVLRGAPGHVLVYRPMERPPAR